MHVTHSEDTFLFGLNQNIRPATVNRLKTNLGFLGIGSSSKNSLSRGVGTLLGELIHLLTKNTQIMGDLLKGIGLLGAGFCLLSGPFHPFTHAVIVFLFLEAADPIIDRIKLNLN